MGNLTKLDNRTVHFLKSKTIYCYEKSAGYLSNLKERYPAIFANIIKIIDPNPRYQGEIMGLPVVGSEVIDTIDWTSSVLIITSDYYKEAYDNLVSNFGNLPETIYYFLNIESEIELEYLEKYRERPLQQAVLFRSGPHSSSYVPGTDFADNALAVFQYMLSQGYNENYKLIWMVKYPDDFSEYTRKYKNVEFISFDWNDTEDIINREKYYEALYTSKYILMTDAYGFARNCRPDQIRVQLWHGCGFKTRTNFVPCERRYDYNIVISPLYKQIHADIYGLRDDQVVITGYPKADWLFHPVDQSSANMLGIEANQKCIFWLPTFRAAKGQLAELNEKAFDGDTGLPIVESKGQLEKLDELLGKLNAMMLVKLHPFQDETLIDISGTHNIKLIKNEDLFDLGIQINQILGYANGLISDYSSVAVEYMNLDRPIGFTLDDVEEYKSSRGFVFDHIEEYLPGKKIYDSDDFLDFVNDTLTGLDPTADKRHKLIEKMHTYHDDKSCERVVDWMLSLKNE